MASNDFLNPEGTTTVTVMSDTPIEGVSRYGPYMAYRVRTADGADHMLYANARVKEQLAGKNITRGTTLEIQGCRAHSREGRPYTRFDVVRIANAGIDAPVPPARTHARDDSDTRMLRCVALKCAAQTRGITGEPPEVLTTANVYFEWLVQP